MNYAENDYPIPWKCLIQNRSKLGLFEIHVISFNWFCKQIWEITIIKWRMLYWIFILKMTNNSQFYKFTMISTQMLQLNVTLQWDTGLGIKQNIPWHFHVRAGNHGTFSQTIDSQQDCFVWWGVRVITTTLPGHILK